MILISCTHDSGSDSVDYMKRAMEHGNNFRYDSSLYYLTLAEKDYNENDDKKGLMKVYNGLGKVFYETGNFILSKEYYLKSLEISEDINAQKWKMHILNNLGDTERSLGNYEESSKYLISALVMSQNINKDSLFSYKLYNNLANLYYDNDQIDSAKKYYLKAYELSNNLIVRNRNSILNNLGGLYYKLGLLDSAIYYYKFSFEEAIKISDTLNMILSLKNSYSILEHETDENEILEIYQNTTSSFVKGTSAYLLYKKNKDDDINKAYYFISESIKYFKKSGDFKELINSIKLIIPLSEKLNKEMERQKYYKLLFEIIDEINAKNIDNKRYIDLAEKQYHLEIMKKNLKLKDKELQKTRYFKLGLIILIIFSIILVSIIIKLKKTSNERNQVLYNFSDFLKNRRNI